MADIVEEHILLVESDILIRQPLAEYLRGCGYKVVEAAGVTEARKLLIEGEFRIDIVLADVDSDQSGTFELAKWIRGQISGRRSDVGGHDRESYADCGKPLRKRYRGEKAL